MSKKELINYFANKIGLNVTKYIRGPVNSIPFDSLFDIGANTGQYAKSIFNQGFTGNVISFEPLSGAHEILKSNASKNKNWIVHDRCAIGESNKEIEINLSKNSVSSSILPIKSSHTTAAPESVYISKEKVKLITLDSIFEMYASKNKGNYLKIDTQGYEYNVIQGSSYCMKYMNAVEIELSTTNLYEQSKLYNYYFNFFDEAGFTLWSIDQVFFPNQTDNRLLQFDAIFIKKSLV